MLKPGQDMLVSKGYSEQMDEEERASVIDQLFFNESLGCTQQRACIKFDVSQRR